MKKFYGISVTPRSNEPPEAYIKRFTKKVRESRILDEWRMNQYYEKPSVKIRRKHNAAVWKARQLEE